MRAETGPMQFDDDWNGVFIRGDTALFFAELIRRISDDLSQGAEIDPVSRAMLLDLGDLMSRANHHVSDPDRQLLKKFQECKL